MNDVSTDIPKMISLYEQLSNKYQHLEQSFEMETVIPQISLFFDQLKSFVMKQITNYFKFSMGFTKFERKFENIKNCLRKLKEMQKENTKMRFNKSVKLRTNYLHYEYFFKENQSKFESERVSKSKEELGNKLSQDFPFKQITNLFTSSLKSTLKKYHSQLQMFEIEQYNRINPNPTNDQVIYFLCKYKIEPLENYIKIYYNSYIRFLYISIQMN